MAAGGAGREGTERFGHPRGPDARSRRATQRTHGGMLKRGAQKATTEMGRVGDEDPVTGTSSSARRYAEAVFELASEEGRIAEWQRQLAALKDLISEPTVEHVLTNPTIPAARPLELIASPQ